MHTFIFHKYFVVRAENQVSTNDFRNSDPAVEWRNSSEITEMAAELLISPIEVPKDALTSPKDGTPKRQDLSNIGRTEEDFDKGYDSDGEIGPFWGVLKQEGEQLFEEQPLSTAEETTTARYCSDQPDRTKYYQCVRGC